MQIAPTFRCWVTCSRSSGSFRFFDITPEEFRKSNRALATKLWANDCEQYQLEKPYRRKDGNLVGVRLRSSLVPGSGNVARLALAHCEDIAERKQAEELPGKSEERWRTHHQLPYTEILFGHSLS